MIDEIWQAQVLDVVDQIADRDFQVRAWNGVGPEVSSFEEVISQLLDDQSFADFCETLDDLDRREKSNVLLLKLNALDKSLQGKAPIEIIDEPSWVNVRLAAVDLLRAFGRPEGKIKGVL